ncbi:hypothetical protein [uncultured Alcanivorax sp.]|uniref:hypothetical protein n=1 Tax=uncultured Alcanivorax sp. TaxID=191215 RepID=UPI00262FF0D3|nr:hypothetical protein [uncultured Alcanivorax sp.]
MNAQTRFLADNETVGNRTTASFYVNGEDASELFLEFNDNRTRYPDAVAKGLKESGYLSKDSDNLYLVPLGQGLPVVRDDTSTDALTALGHIKPVRFADPEGQHLAPLRDNGRLYIFVGGYLWRELVVSDDGNTFRDINLAKYQGCDQRPPDDGMETEIGAITVPHRLNGGPVLLQIAFSEIPWSWALIEILGGLADEDPRYLPSLPEHAPYQWHRDNVDHALRLQRTTLLNVNSFDGQGSPDTLKQTALIGAQQANDLYNQPDENGLLALPQLSRADIQDNLPVAALQDPLGIAFEGVGKLTLLMNELCQHVMEIDRHEHAKSAVYAYQTFFNQSLHQRETYIAGRAGEQSRYVQHSDSADNLRDAADRLDRDHLEAILRVKERRELRQTIRQQRRETIAWLDSKTPEGNDASQGFQYFLSPWEALRDYAWLPVPGDEQRHTLNPDEDHATPDYSAFWKAISGLLSGLGSDPSVIDSAYDADPDPEWDDDNDPVHALRSQLLKPDHPLHAALIPGADQIPVDDDYLPELEEAKKPATDSNFRHAAYAAVTGSHPDWWYWQQTRNQTESIVASLLFGFQKQWQDALANQQEDTIEILMRLGKGSGPPDLHGARLFKTGSVIPEGWMIIDAKERVFEPLKRSQRRDIIRQGGLDAEGRVKVLDPTDPGKVLGSSDATELTYNRGIPRQLTNQNWTDLYQEVGQDGLTRVKQTVMAVPPTSEYARHWNQPDSQASTGARLTTGAIKVANKTLPPAMGLLEVFNLLSVYENGKKNGWGIRNASQFFIGGIALTYCIADTAVQLAGEDRVANWLTFKKWKRVSRFTKNIITGTKNFRTFKVYNFKMIGVGLTGFGAFLSAWDAGIQLEKGNYESAAAHGVAAGAMAGATFSQLGRSLVLNSIKSTMFTRALVVLGPWGWAFTAVSIIAVITAEWLKLSPLERWAQFGPFGDDPEDRFTEEYRDLTVGQVYQSLLSLLMTPKPIITESQNPSNQFKVEVHAPVAGENGKIHHAVVYQDQHGDLQTLKSLAWVPILANKEDPQSRTGLIAWYEKPEFFGTCTFYVRARFFHEEEECWLPFRPEDVALDSGNDHTALDPDTAPRGWAQATLTLKKADPRTFAF